MGRAKMHKAPTSPAAKTAIVLAILALGGLAFYVSYYPSIRKKRIWAETAEKNLAEVRQHEKNGAYIKAFTELESGRDAIFRGGSVAFEDQYNELHKRLRPLKGKQVKENMVQQAKQNLAEAKRLESEELYVEAFKKLNSARELIKQTGAKEMSPELNELFVRLEPLQAQQVKERAEEARKKKQAEDVLIAQMQALVEELKYDKEGLVAVAGASGKFHYRKVGSIRMNDSLKTSMTVYNQSTRPVIRLTLRCKVSFTSSDVGGIPKAMPGRGLTKKIEKRIPHGGQHTFPISISTSMSMEKLTAYEIKSTIREAEFEPNDVATAKKFLAIHTKYEAMHGRPLDATLAKLAIQYGSLAMQEQAAEKPSAELFPLNLPLPKFPALGESKVLSPSDTSVYFVDFGTVPGNAGPGMAMTMRVYLPPGNHAPGSIGCVLVAPAGTNLLSGNAMDNDDYHAEVLPYAQAGMAVVFYSMDGHMKESCASDQAETAAMAAAYKQFKAAGAGVINGRNALEFVKAKLPQVDPNRIYAAGHSSAAVASLLLAAHEPRIKACIAYAPATDVKLRMIEIIQDPGVKKFLPGVQEFLTQGSPRSHYMRIRCPVFLFHAKDDSNEPFASSARFARLMRMSSLRCDFVTVKTGNHYQSMIDQGIPRGIEWLKEIERGSSTD